MKKTLFLLSVLLLSVTNAIGAITWNIENGTLTIGGTGAMDDYSAGGAPWYPQRNSIITIVILNGVTHIGNYSFYNCEQANSLTIENSVQTIGYSAFEKCSALTDLTISKFVNEIGGIAFKDCSSLKKVTIENHTTTLTLELAPAGGIKVFAGCNSIETVHLGRDITTEGPYYYDTNPFSDKKKLATLTIGNNVRKINRSSFDGCSELLKVEIPNSVEKIGDYAFRNCEQLNTLIIGNSVQTIGYSAFEKCAITDLTIPKLVDEIGGIAFKDCSRLKKVTIENYPTTLILELAPVGGLKIFAGCNNIETVHLGRDITTEGPYYYDTNPFSDKKKLATLTIGNNVRKINRSSFDGCSGLFKVEIPNSVEEIGDYAFRNCEQLDTLIIGNNVQIIGYSAFEKCSALREITTYPTVPNTFNNAFNSVNKNIPVLINCGYLTAYKNANCWEDFTNYRSIDTQELCELGIEDITPTQLVIYPNPTTGELIIENGELKIKEIKIFDVYGREQKTKSRKSKVESGMQIDISEFPTGIYFVQISTEVGEVVRRVVKE